VLKEAKKISKEKKVAQYKKENAALRVIREEEAYLANQCRRGGCYSLT